MRAEDAMALLQREIDLRIEADMVRAVIRLCASNSTLRAAVMESLRKQGAQS